MEHIDTIFLDHAAITPVHPEVLGLMLPYFGNYFGTPSNPFGFGDAPREALERARCRVAQLIGAQGHEIIFTSSGTEANNLAILGCASARRGLKNHIITSTIEHASVLNTIHHLKEAGLEVTEIGVDAQGVVDPASVQAAIKDDTILISIMHASNETGSIQPVREIGHIAKDRGITFHCDCIQSAGRIEVDVNTLNADLLSISSHKLYGPKGVGALYVREDTAVSPIIFGSDQERGLRPGTQNIPGIVGFGMACEKARIDLDKNARHIIHLRDMLEKALHERLPGVRINDEDALRLPHISSISFEGVQADALAAWLDLVGITVSARTLFYSKRSSHALSALHIPPDLAFSTIRFSPGWENTASQIERVVKTIQQTVIRLREFARGLDNDESCVVTFAAGDDVARALRNLENEGLPCIVTARPVELAHLKGTRSALAIPCSREDEAGRLLGSQNISITGMHRIKGLCRHRGEKEEQFWKNFSRIKEGKKPKKC
jgi:cysteine desulfurase